MTRFLKFIKIASLCSWLAMAVAFLLANIFVMRSEMVQQFILDYGLQMVYCPAIMVLVADFLHKRYERIQLILRDGRILSGIGWFFIGLAVLPFMVTPFKDISFATIYVVGGIGAVFLLLGWSFYRKQQKLLLS